MQSVRIRTLCTTALAIFLAMVVAGEAHAQSKPDDTQRSAARTLANDGLAAFNAGKHAEAIELFGRAEALVHAPPHLLFIARSHAALGKLVQAYEAYVKITREELASNAPKAFLDAKKNATTEQAALEPRIPKLTIVVKGGPTSPTITMDDVDVPVALLGISHRVDPGTHTLRAKTAGWKSKSDVVVKLAEGANETATIELVVDESARSVATGSAPSETKRSKLGVAPWVALGIGVAGVGAGTFFMLQNRSKRDEADGICGDGPCPAARRDEIVDLDKSADSAATIAWIGYGVGAAGIIAGATMLILGRSQDTTAAKNVKVWFGATSASMAVRF